MKKIMIAVTLVAAALNIVSCNPKELLRPGLEPAFVVIDGDTVKTRDDKAFKDKINKYDKKGFFETSVVGDTIMVFKAPKKLKPAKLADLAKHKNTNIPDLKGKPFKMVAVGGNLTQGMRDGGIFNEGILTSYPTLIANQMGIDFNNALFDPSEYNGLGRKVATTFNPTAGPVPKQKEVSNNLAIENGKLKKFYGLTDNYFIRLGNHYSLDNLSERFSSSAHFLNPRDGLPASFANQLKNSKLKFDFLFIEMGLQDIINENQMGGKSMNLASLNELNKTKINSNVEIFSDPITGGGSPLYQTLFKLLVSQQLNKGVIINCPDLEDLGFYRRNYLPEIKKIAETYNTRTGIGDVILVLGSQKIDSLLSPRVNINSKPYISSNEPYFQTSHLFLTESTLKYVNESIKERNEESKILSAYSNMPIFDINAFYKELHRGNVTSLDGIKVDAKWPGGNFFSIDGVYPSAFGQAVIANEVIKTMNSFYKMDVPLIPCAEYLK
jgi:hypothetical protein